MTETQNSWSHGGDRNTFYEKTGREPLDFSANLSPLGLPEGVRRAAEEAAGASDRYPDPLCRDLCRGIAAAACVPADWCLCGAGAAGLIWRATWAFRPFRALVPAPAFSEYTAALTAAGASVQRHRLSPETGFALDASFPSAVTDKTNMVFLCSPNNPTGRTVPRALVRETAERCRAVGAVLVLDECFMGFVEQEEELTFLPLLKDFPNVILLNAFTKLYAMAGLRLGFALCSSPERLDAMRTAGPPWDVSVPAQAAGLAALKETGYRTAVRELVCRERPFLEEGLRSLGAEMVPGEANFLLFRLPAPGSGAYPLQSLLMEKGILIRSGAGFAGLGPDWYRIAVRTRPENERLLAALKEVLQ